VNVYKFVSYDSKPSNSGVTIKASCHSEDGSDYYGMLNEVVEVVYQGPSWNRVTLFRCHWFNPAVGVGTRHHTHVGLVEIHSGKSYWKYDPFIFAHNANQVYYTPYPSKDRRNRDWWVVYKTKPRGLFNPQHTVEVAYQEEDQTHVDDVVENEPISSLADQGCWTEVDTQLGLSERNVVDSESEFESEGYTDDDDVDDDDPCLDESDEEDDRDEDQADDIGDDEEE
jgi:hypothetical protein